MLKLLSLPGVSACSLNLVLQTVCIWTFISGQQRVSHEVLHVPECVDVWWSSLSVNHILSILCWI